MSRRINFTGRKRIHRSDLGVMLERTENSLGVTVTKLELDALALPHSANIFLEIYHQTFHHRIHCGTVGSPSVPTRSEIDDFAAPELLKCRVLIVNDDAGEDRGKVLAQADRVPVSVLGGAGPSRGLLPVGPDDLGNLLWRMNFTDGPTLLINDTTDWRALSKSDWFRSLVYPEALRRIYLWTIVQLREGADGDDSLEDWVQYFDLRLQIKVREDANDADADIESLADEAVTRFAEALSTHKFWPSELTEEA